MAKLKRGWKWFVALSVISAMLARVREAWTERWRADEEMGSVTPPPDPDGAEKELKRAIVAKQGAEQAPARMGFAGIIEGNDTVAAAGSAA